MKMKRFLHLGLLALLWAGCAPAAATNTEPQPRSLTVFAAASLTDAFTELGENFELANPGVDVTFNFAGSQALRTQIEEGAPADVFASANAKEMDALVSRSRVDASTLQQFLSNRLVVILPANNPAGIETLNALAAPGVKLVLAAEEVPVGNYARQSLELMNGQFGADFKDNVLANVVSNEDNVKQVVAKVHLGEADVGIVYTSDAVAAPDLKRIKIPAGLNVIAVYPIAPLAESANIELANAFIDYVLSAEGQAILHKWGFAPVD
jgi:molybdate transport system substrate-binding protein